MLKIFNNIYAFVLELFYPGKCIICLDFDQLLLCNRCRRLVKINQIDLCPLCGRVQKWGKYCQDCKSNKNVFLDGLLVCTDYNNSIVKEIIYKLKYHGFLPLALIISQIFKQKLKLSKVPKRSLMLIPVPLFWQKSLIRGFNQSESICRILSNNYGYKWQNILKRSKNTLSQSKLSRKDRVKNVKDAFIVKKTKLDDNTMVFLVDDISTTTNTLNQCAKVLKAQGIKEVYSIVFAKNLKFK